jgi:hypothetical protein
LQAHFVPSILIEMPSKLLFALIFGLVAGLVFAVDLDPDGEKSFILITANF